MVIKLWLYTGISTRKGWCVCTTR